MGDLARRTGRLWTTILVAWALVLASLLPVAASGGSLGRDDAGVLCLTAPSGDPTAPAGHADHGLLCCVLCAPAAQLPVPDAASAAVVPPVLPALRASRPAEEARPRAPPGAFPLNPRAPPIAA